MAIRLELLSNLTMRIPAKEFFLHPPLTGTGLQVAGIGHREMMQPGFINRPSGTGDFLLMYFHTSCHAGCSPAAPQIPAGSLFVWGVGDFQYYGHGRRRYCHSWIHCNGPLVAELLQTHEIPLRSPIPLAPESILRFFEDIHRELIQERNVDEIIAENLFENWIRDLRRSLHQPSTQVSENLRVAREYIDNHYEKPVTLGALALIAHQSNSHFSSEFKRSFGVSPIDYLIRRRLDRAAYLLRDVNLNVTQIAERVGYENLFHFSKQFKKYHGMSPRSMRQTFRPS